MASIKRVELAIDVAHDVTDLDLARPRTPEQALMLGVLSRAIADLNPGMDTVANGKGSRQMIRDAKAWFISDAYHYGSFQFVCGELDLEPGYIRHLLATRQPRKQWWRIVVSKRAIGRDR